MPRGSIVTLKLAQIVLIRFTIFEYIFSYIVYHIVLWYTLTDIDMAASTLRCATEVQSLKFWAAKTIISRKINYFKLDEKISETAIDNITNAYKMFNVCEGCTTAKLLHEQGELS